jgi:CBS domain containing-hemolysin-like protein
MPVYKEDRDHIIGILTERDFFTAYIKKQKIDLRTLVSTPLYVSKELKVDDLIRKMQAAKKHFAIVSDEYGGTSGIVTLEDAIEELFGEIYDEHDDDDDQVQHLLKQDDNTYIVSADLLVEELADTLELGKVPETTYPTVGGFLYGLVEELPYEGQVVDYQSFIYENDNDGLIVETPITLRFTLLSVVERRIIKARLEIIGSKKSEKNQDTKEQD